ncbi:hypothetical protein LY76DRAFT_596817 [Colletotrichum caudatum]|nr:hypothetical protein LY76DRAFT_596817 [Colletotrichum caudatum]
MSVHAKSGRPNAARITGTSAYSALASSETTPLSDVRSIYRAIKVFCPSNHPELVIAIDTVRRGQALH